MIDKARWDRSHAEMVDNEADKLERECIDPQLKEGRVQTIRRDGRRVVACFSAHSVAPDVVAVLLKRAQSAGWSACIDSASGYFEVSLP